MEEKTVNTDVCGIYCGRLAFNLKKGKPIHFHLTSNIQETQHSRNQLSCVCYFTRDLPGLVTLSHNNPNNKISYWVGPNFSQWRQSLKKCRAAAALLPGAFVRDQQREQGQMLFSFHWATIWGKKPPDYVKPELLPTGCMAWEQRCSVWPV